MNFRRQADNPRWLLPELHPVWRYTLAFAFPTAALGIALLLPLHATNPVLAFFVVAAAVSAWLGGGSAGVFSCAVAFAEADYFLIPPRFSFAVAGTSQFIRLLNAVAVCLIAAFITTKLRNAWRHNIELLEQEREASAAVQEAEEREREALQKEAEARRQAERDTAQLAAILDSMSERVYVCDAEGNPLLMNTAFRNLNLLNNPAQANVRTLHQDLEVFDLEGNPILADDRPVFRVLRGERLSSLELCLRRKNGKPDVIVRYSGAPVRDAQGKIAMAVITSEDVTAAKKAQVALIRSEKLASTGRMTATIAHEINNPLSAAMNATYLAKCDSALSSETRQLLSVVDEELQRAAQITRQTLGFYRESGRPEAVDVSDVAEAVLGLHSKRIVEKGLEVRRRYRKGQTAMGSIGEFRQIISNLVANAVDACHSGDRLEIRTSSLQGWVRITVADTGCGIAAQHLPQLFEPFFTTKETLGTGLGLWVSQELVKKHEGHIRVRSCPGRGTVFCVYFPAVAQPEQAASTAIGP